MPRFRPILGVNMIRFGSFWPARSFIGLYLDLDFLATNRVL